MLVFFHLREVGAHGEVGQLERLGALSVIELEAKSKELETGIAAQRARLEREREAEKTAIEVLRKQLAEARKAIVETEDLALLQEAGIYHYQHPLTDAVAYEKELEELEAEVKEMTRKDGGAVLAVTSWTVNGSATEGKKMVRDFSKLMLRAFNAEADTLELFQQPDAWSQARSLIDTFQFYAQNIMAGVEVDMATKPNWELVGPNTFKALVNVDAFRKLADWNIKVALEIGAVKPGDCDAMKNADLTVNLIRRIQDAGGTVDYVAIDEPIPSSKSALWENAMPGLGCHLTLAEAATATVKYCEAVRDEQPRRTSP